MTLPAELFENAPCGFVTSDSDGVITLVNETFLNWTGYSREQVIGTPFRNLLDPGSMIFHETRHLPVLRLQGEVREVAMTIRNADGRDMAILMNASIHGDELWMAVFDSTVRQEYERDLLFARRAAESSELRVRVLQDASNAFGASATAEALSAALLASVNDALAASSSIVVLVDPTGIPYLAAGIDPFDGALDDATPRPEREARTTGTVVSISSSSEVEERNPQLAAAMRAARIEAVSSTPLMGPHGPLGVVTCYFGRERTFDASTADLQEALARQAVQALVRIRLQTQLEQLALYDQLTGLTNRKLLQERLSEALRVGTLAQTPVSVVFIDLDGFKAVNDSLGHAAGDSVLQQVAARIRATVRHDDTVARFGGDEFVVACENTDRDAVMAVVERMALAIAQPLEGIPSALPVTASVGIAVYVPGGSWVPSTDELLDVADAAMYRSKQAGRNGITVELV